MGFRTTPVRVVEHLNFVLDKMTSSEHTVPNLFLVGAMKAGTTSLYELLAESKLVNMCRVKEPNHFCKDFYTHPDFASMQGVHNFSGLYWVPDTEEYLNLFDRSNSQYVAECSTTYLYSEVAAREIYKFNPSSKIIILLRNPIERAYSEYVMNRAIGATAKSFGEVVRIDIKNLDSGLSSIRERYLMAGMYFNQVKRFLDEFPREQVFIGVVDRPDGKFRRIVSDLQNFLGIPLEQDEALITIGSNKAKVAAFERLNRFLYVAGLKALISRSTPQAMKNLVKHVYYRDDSGGGIAEADRELLASVFRPDIEKLSALIQQDLSHWQSVDLNIRKVAGRSGTNRNEKKIALVWENFGPSHADRCDALSIHFRDKMSVVGIEICGTSATYDWEPERGTAFSKDTLFPGKRVTEIAMYLRFWKLLCACVRSRARHIFLCHYEDPAIFLTAIALKCLGRFVFVMNDSKFDDYRRSLWREAVKFAFYLPYDGALAGSQRTKDYLRFLGFRADRVEEPYNAISVARIRALVDNDGKASKVVFADRHFSIVARLVPKKNIKTAIRAYGIYSRLTARPRPLHIYGSGELELELKAQAVREGVAHGVRFHGFLQTAGIASALRSTLALLLPSVEEQFGIVVIEALAAAVPVILSQNCGACDALIRTGVNGFIFDPMNAEGLAFYMNLLCGDEALWTTMSEAADRTACLADAERFAEAVERLIEKLP